MSHTEPIPRIAVALATYNGAAFLEPLLESLQAQSFPPCLIAVVDDGSSDTTWEILQKFQSRLPLLLTKHSANQGHRAAFSDAMALCREADFVALADQDDVWEPEKLEVLLRLIGSADLIHSDASVIRSDGSPLYPSWHRHMNRPGSQSLLSYVAGFNNVTGCTALFRSSLLNQMLPIPSGVPVHDWWLALHAASGKGIVFHAAPLIRYRLHDNNAVGEGKKVLSLEQSLLRRLLWYRTVLSCAHLDQNGLNFAHRLKRHCQARLDNLWTPCDLPWLWHFRSVLFPSRSGWRRLSSLLFSLAGLRLARFFGKH